MALKEITSKIAADAETEAEKIIAEAEAKADSIRSEAREKAERETARITGEGEARAKRAREAVLSAAHLAARARLLEAKQKVVGEVLESAAERLASLGPDEFRATLKRLIGEMHLAGAQKLLVRPADRDKVTAEFLAELNDALGDDARIEAVETADDVASGYVLVQDRKRVNGDFADAVAFNRGEIEMLAAKVLFPKKDGD